MKIYVCDYFLKLFSYYIVSKTLVYWSVVRVESPRQWRHACQPTSCRTTVVFALRGFCLGLLRTTPAAPTVIPAADGPGAVHPARPWALQGLLGRGGRETPAQPGEDL